MAYLIGVALAAEVGRLAAVVGFDRDRAFYPTVMIVIPTTSCLPSQAARQRRS